jgi:hypothetical protein
MKQWIQKLHAAALVKCNKAGNDVMETAWFEKARLSHKNSWQLAERGRVWLVSDWFCAVES